MGRIFFVGGTLLDGVNAAQDDMTVVIEGSRIVAVEHRTLAPHPAGEDLVFDIAGKTLMPGLFQCHLHAAMDDIMSYKELDFKYPANYLTLIAARNVDRLLRLGFTSAVGAGSPANIDVVLKHAIAAGIIMGPRLHACSPHIITTGESIDYMPTFWKSDIRDGFGRICDGPEEFRKAVRSEIKDGVDIVKVHVSGGHGSNLSAGCLAVTYEELRAATEAAHERGRKIRTHAPSKAGILMSVRAGVDLVDHCDFMDDECIEALLKSGTSIAVGVLGAVRSCQALEAMDRQSAEDAQMHAAVSFSSPFFNQIRMDKREFEDAVENLRTYIPRAVEAGVNIINGDDFGGAIVPHGTYADELVTYVKEIGVPAGEVITWATRNSARFLGEADLGIVGKGKIADLLVVESNPVQDIAVLQQGSNFLAIMKGGVLVECKLESRSEMPETTTRSHATLKLA